MPPTEKSEHIPGLSIVVCTLNRSSILMECLGSLARQSVGAGNYEVMVVDNDSADDTRERVGQFMLTHENFRLVSEPSRGLSHARNRGWREARAEWIAYIDDDALAPENFVERILSVISDFEFDCFGGRYIPWYRSGKPAWYRDEYGSSVVSQQRVGVLEHGHLSGGVMVVRRAALSRVNGFPPFLGMKGDAVSYGEDTYLQTRLKAQGCRIGFDPDLVIRHLVPAYKMHVRWFLRSAFQRGKVSWMSVGKEPTALNFLRLFKIMLYDAAYTVIPSTRRLLRGECFIQNWVIDILRPQAKNFGTLCGAAVMLLERRSSCSDHSEPGKAEKPVSPGRGNP